MSGSAEPEGGQRHWESVYRSRSDGELSWWQSKPLVSRHLIERYARMEDRILDAGGGSSALAEQLHHHGFRHVVVLDLSRRAIHRARSRMSAAAQGIRWVQGDVTGDALRERFDLWHDRALFHFMVSPGDRAAYLRTLDRSLVPGGIAVIGTFSRQGPTTCSGLPVRRYTPSALAREFGPRYTLETSRRERHRTPWGMVQPFVYVVLRKTG